MKRSKSVPVLEGIPLEENRSLTLSELCRACGVHAEVVLEMIDEGVVEPAGRSPTGPPTQWLFSEVAVVRAHRALRLRRDLRVNWPGAALALDLLEQIERLERR